MSAARGDASVTVWSTIYDLLINSLVLAVITLLILVPCAIGLGVLAALRAGKPSDQVVSTVTLALSAMSEFLLGAILILTFFTGLHWLPPISLLQRAEVAGDHVTEPVEVASQEMLIRMELRAQGSHVLSRGLFAQHRPCDSARQCLNCHEDEKGDCTERQDPSRDAPHHEPGCWRPHAMAPVVH